MLRRGRSPSPSCSPAGPVAPLLQRYEPAEPRLLRSGRFGPVLRAKDLQTQQLVALKVFHAAEAYHRGKLPGCRTVAEAQEEVLRVFKAQVRALQRAQTPRDSGVVQLLHLSSDSTGEPAAAADGCCYLVMELGMFTMEQLVRDSRTRTATMKLPPACPRLAHAPHLLLCCR